MSKHNGNVKTMDATTTAEITISLTAQEIKLLQEMIGSIQLQGNMQAIARTLEAMTALSGKLARAANEKML